MLLLLAETVQSLGLRRQSLQGKFLLEGEARAATSHESGTKVLSDETEFLEAVLSKPCEHNHLK